MDEDLLGVLAEDLIINIRRSVRHYCSTHNLIFMKVLIKYAEAIDTAAELRKSDSDLREPTRGDGTTPVQMLIVRRKKKVFAVLI